MATHPSRTTALLVGVALVALAAAGIGATMPTRATRPPTKLTANGTALWQFEALLHDVFGNRRPFASSASYDTNFACAGNSCFPHARWDPYAYVFANARGSVYRLKSRSFPPGAFGNYPVPLKINDLYIACTRAATTFLVTVRGVAGFALSCERPLP